MTSSIYTELFLMVWGSLVLCVAARASHSAKLVALTQGTLLLVSASAGAWVLMNR